MTISRPRRAGVVGALAATLVAATALTGHASTTPPGDQEPPPEPSGGITPQALHDSVLTFEPASSVRHFAADEHVISLGDDTSTEDGTTTISLSTDLLFRENTWELPANAPGRIADLTADVPDGATVQVVGHTDTQQPVGHDFDNQELSENRAGAVAQALEAERPDLTLEVSGLGDTSPAVTADPEDPATHAANRRVEIIYQG